MQIRRSDLSIHVTLDCRGVVDPALLLFVSVYGRGGEGRRREGRGEERRGKERKTDERRGEERRMGVGQIRIVFELINSKIQNLKKREGQREERTIETRRVDREKHQTF